MQSMEYTQTCSTIESCLVEKATIVKTRKNNLLVDLKDSIALLQLGRYVIARKHLIEYLVCVHFLKYLIRVSMDLDFSNLSISLKYAYVHILKIIHFHSDVLLQIVLYILQVT